MKATSVLLLLTAAFGLSAAAQDSDAACRRMDESKKQVREYLIRAAEGITARAAEEIRSAESWDQVRGRRMEEMRDMLGLLPWPARTPLRPRIAGVLDQGAYTIEKLAFESLPKVYVTANVYVPKNREGPLPAIVYVCGHAFSPHGAKAMYQRHGHSLAKNGYVAIILDPIQISETFALHHGVSNQEMYDWYTRGYTPAGVEVWNAIRAIDYLEARPEVDKNRIGMTGRSGGAAMSWFTAAIEPRVKVVAPVMGISTYAANVREDTQRLHCDCMFAINSALQDMLHQGALIAPRPLLMAHGIKDALFPVPGYKEFEERIGALYRAYGRPEAFLDIEVESGHQDSDYLREQAIRWFDRHLKNVPERPLDMEYTDLPAESLSVFQGRPPADAQNYRIHETFTTRPPSPPFRNRAAWESRRSQLLEALRAHVFRTLPEKPAAVRVQTLAAEKGQPQELQILVEDGVPLRALLRKPPKLQAPAPALLYIASDGEDPQAISSFLRGVNMRNVAVWMAVYPRGVGEAGWDKTFWKATLRNAMHVGHTVDSMRLADVLAALEALRQQEGIDPARITVAGNAVAGALGLYAAILDPRIAQVVLIGPPSSHAQGPVFLNVLRHTDLPEAAALLAPRPLTFYGRMPAAYGFTQSVYGLYGKPGRLFVSMSLEAVLEGRFDHNFAAGL